METEPRIINAYKMFSETNQAATPKWHQSSQKVKVCFEILLE